MNAVDALLAQRDHPLQSTIQAVRSRLLDLAGVVESVKWNSPNYALADDFATLHLRRDDSVQLILHTGAVPKPDHPEIVLAHPPSGSRRADRNRLVVTFRRDDPSPADADVLADALKSWVAQLV